MEDILKKLVSFRTISGNAVEMHALLDYVDNFVSQRGMCVQRYVWNGFESLVATVRPDNKTPTVMLAAHADVVHATDDMFTMRTMDGKHIGRGVLDMKFAIAAYLQIIDSIQPILQNYDIGLMITSDEELGGSNGVAKLVDLGYIPKVCILPDGGDNWQVQTSSKGLLIYEISTTGKTAHGARPWLGDNALIKLISLLDEIASLFPKYPHSGTNTISLNGMSGGEALSQIPGFAKMIIDIRTTDSYQYAKAHEAVLRICARHKAVCTVMAEGAPTRYELNNPFIAPYAQLVTEITGIPMRGFSATGSSDARYYVPYGIPCILSYPNGGNLHCSDEWIEAAALQQFKTIIRRYLDKVAKCEEVLYLGNLASIDGSVTIS